MVTPGMLIMAVVQAAIDRNKFTMNVIGAIVSCTISLECCSQYYIYAIMMPDLCTWIYLKQCCQKLGFYPNIRIFEHETYLI